jgi:hypothetical protein
MRHASLLLVLALLAPGLANAQTATDKKAEAEAKLKEANKKSCEIAVKLVLGNEKTCPDEAAAIKKLTCSDPGAGDESRRLNDACAVKLKAAAAAKASAKQPASAPALKTCKALDPGTKAVLAEETAAKMSECTKKLKAGLLAARCDGTVKMVQYLEDAGGKEPYKTTAYCPKPAPAAVPIK